MDLTVTQWIIAILFFLGVSAVLTRATYSQYKQESGPRYWKTQGGQAGYFRVLVLVSIGVTVVLMAFIKTITAS